MIHMHSKVLFIVKAANFPLCSAPNLHVCVLSIPGMQILDCSDACVKYRLKYLSSFVLSQSYKVGDMYNIVLPDFVRVET